MSKDDVTNWECPKCGKPRCAEVEHVCEGELEAWSFSVIKFIETRHDTAMWFVFAEDCEGRSVHWVPRDTELEAQVDLERLKASVPDLLSGLKGGPSKVEMMELIYYAYCAFITLFDGKIEVEDWIKQHFEDLREKFKDLIARHEKAEEGDWVTSQVFRSSDNNILE